MFCFFVTNGCDDWERSSRNAGVLNGGTFTMSGGTITDVFGNGVSNQDDNSVFIMTGGSITGNSRGLSLVGTFKVSGSASIQGNTNGNVIIENSSKTITVDGVLSDSARIGVTKTARVDVNFVPATGVITSGLKDKGTASNFTSDNGDYAVSLTSGGEAQLVQGYKVTYDRNDATDGSTTDSKAYATGDTVTVKDNGFTAPAGLTFAGWNTKADGTGGMYVPGDSSRDTFVITANTTLYAIWAHTHGEGDSAITFYAWTDAAAKAMYPEEYYTGATANGYLPERGNYVLLGEVRQSMAP